MQSDVIFWILLTLFFGVFADKKEVKQDSLVLLFENVTADNVEKDVSLFVNGKGNASLIVTFKLNGHISMDWKASNYKKIYMDATKNIWIANIDETYEKKFYIESSTRLGEVELTILKTNSTPQKETTQKGDALPETSSTTERTALNENTQKDDAFPVYANVLIGLLVFLILMMIIIGVVMKKQRFSRVLFKKCNSVPQPVRVTSHHDSPDSTSYKLMWDEPDDGGSPLIKYNIRYCEVKIIPDRTVYELSTYLTPFESVDNILPSAVSYELSPLIPGRYYLVEIQAIHTQGQSLKSFIFKTKEGVPQPVQVRSHRDSPDSTSYQLMWDKPDDGGSLIIKYIIQYCEMKISLNGTEYELMKPLNPLEISPSDESYTLSSLKPGSFYQVEVQAVNTMGMSSKMFIFKTKENETNPKLRARPSKNIESLSPRIDVPNVTENSERLPPRNNDTDFTDTQSSTSNREKNTNINLKKTPKEKLDSDSDSDSNEEQVALLNDIVDLSL